VTPRLFLTFCELEGEGFVQMPSVFLAKVKPISCLFDLFCAVAFRLQNQWGISGGPVPKSGLILGEIVTNRVTGVQWCRLQSLHPDFNKETFQKQGRCRILVVLRDDT